MAAKLQAMGDEAYFYGVAAGGRHAGVLETPDVC